MLHLACATLSAEGFQDSGYEKTFSMIPAAGYRYIEFNMWFGTSLLPSMVESIRERLEKHDLKAASVFVVNLGADGTRLDVDVGHKIRGLEAAEALGCERLVLGAAGKGGRASLEALIAALKLIAPVALDRGIKLCLENHAGCLLEGIEDYAQVLEAIPQENVGICIDTGHFDAAGVSMTELIDRFGERVNHLHVKENRVFGKKDFCRFGEGTTDNHEVIRQLQSIGYEGFITVEQSPQKDRPTSVEDLAKAYGMFREFVQE